MRRLAWLALPLVLGLALVAGGRDGEGARRTQEQRVAAIASGIRCPTCQGLSVEESRAGTARAVREEIERRVQAGETDAEVRAYLVSRYGRAALLRPEAEGFASLVWVLPVAAGVGALLLLAGVLLLRRRRPAVGAAEGGEGARPARRRSTPVLAAAGVIAVAVGAGVVVARSAGERLPNDPVTGSVGLTAPTPRSGLSEARRLMGAGKAADALKVFDRVLKRDPTNPEALAYRGWLLRLAGLSDEGLVWIDKAIAADPSFADAHFFRGVILLQDKGDAAGAIPELRRYLASDPPAEMVGAVEDVLRRALEQAGRS